ncbi:MAG: RNA polymerase sigma factor [Myxococcota bacterium]
MSVDHDQLAQNTADGDAEAFRELVDAVVAPLRRLAQHTVGRADAEDVLQESLTRIYLALRERRYRAEGQFMAWARRIVTRVALDHLRSQRRRRARELAAAPPSTAQNADPLALSEVLQALETLPPKQRIALVLKEVEGLTTREIADAMNSSVGSVEQRLVRARATLRTRWAT